PVLVQIAAVDQRLAEQLRVANREPELSREGNGRGHRGSVPWQSGGKAGWPAAQALGGALVNVFDRVAYGSDPLRILVGDLGPELFLEAHDQLDQVERVGVEVNDDLLQAIVGSGHRIPPGSLVITRQERRRLHSRIRRPTPRSTLPRP